MKWNYFNTTITAVMLITLPFKVMGEHCNASEWNKLLKLQTELDQTYNLHAQKFNQFLQVHNEQPFLYQEFTAQEIRQFWASNKSTLHQSMKSQIEASLFVVNRIQAERVTLQNLEVAATKQQQLWQTISLHCSEVGVRSNTIASQNYAQLNQALTLDIKKLFTKLLILEQRYTKEVDALRQAKSEPEN